MKPKESQRLSASHGTLKKAYQKPRLQVYGDIEEITRSTAKNVHADGAHNANQRNFTH